MLGLTGGANVEYRLFGGVGEFDLHHVGHALEVFEHDRLVEGDVFHNGIFADGDAHHTFSLFLHRHLAGDAVEDVALFWGGFAVGADFACRCFVKIRFRQPVYEVEQVGADSVVLDLEGFVADGLAQGFFIGVVESGK